MWDTFACATAIFLTHFIISIAVLENVPPDAVLETMAFSAHLRRFFAQGKSLAFGEK
jgi:hypothetical protein